MFPTPEFTAQDIEITKTITCHRGFFTLNKLRIRYPLFAGGFTESDFERLEHPGAVCILPYDPVLQKILLIEQFRVGAVGATATSPWLFEAVAGMIEPNEELTVTAHREMREETHLELLDLLPIFNCWLTPGCNAERAWFYCGKVDLSSIATHGGLIDESEDIKLHVLDPDTAFNAVAQGKVMNAFAILVLQWLQLNKNDLDKKWLG